MWPWNKWWSSLVVVKQPIIIPSITQHPIHPKPCFCGLSVFKVKKAPNGKTPLTLT
jgi:hypothetical protein